MAPSYRCYDFKDISAEKFDNKLAPHFCKNWIITLVLKKNAIFHKIGENRRKL
jgi:hypothetical protein